MAGNGREQVGQEVLGREGLVALPGSRGNALGARPLVPAACFGASHWPASPARGSWRRRWRPPTSCAWPAGRWRTCSSTTFSPSRWGPPPAHQHPAQPWLDPNSCDAFPRSRRSAARGRSPRHRRCCSSWSSACPSTPATSLRCSKGSAWPSCPSCGTLCTAPWPRWARRAPLLATCVHSPSPGVPTAPRDPIALMNARLTRPHCRNDRPPPPLGPPVPPPPPAAAPRTSPQPRPSLPWPEFPPAAPAPRLPRRGHRPRAG